MTKPAVWTVALGSALLVAVTACTTSAPSTSPSATPTSPVPTTPAAPSTTSAAPDFDGDGKADLVAALNLDRDSGAWAVRVWYGSGTTRDITSADLGGTSYGIGGAMLARDLDRDGCSELVLGFGSNVQIVPGSASGLDVERRHLVPVTTATNSRVATLTLVEQPVARLVVGIDSESGGEVRAFPLGADGLPTGSPLVLRPGTGTVPKIGNAESFGWSLAGWDDRLFIGTPYAKVAGQRDAGVVTVVTFSASGVSAALNISQDTEGVAGAVGAINYFGNSLAARDGYLAVGVPGDDVGGVEDTGSVQLFSLAGGRLEPLERVSQATAGVPGRTERDDRFGYSVDLATVCPGVLSLVVGGPGEVIAAGHEADGAAWVVPLEETSGCPSVQLYAGHGLTGAPVSLLGLGRELAVIRDAGSGVDDLVIVGRGDAEEGPNGLLARWSRSGGETVRHEGIFRSLAGR